MTADDSNPIARLLHSLDFLDQSETDCIASLFEPVWLKKDEFFIKTGDPVNKVAFIAKGLLCRYNYHQKGHKIIDQYLIENQFFTDRKGYFSHGHSVMTIQAIIPCQLWTIPVTAIEELSNTSINFIKVIKSITSETLDHGLDLKDMLAIGDPLQRIHRFYEFHPHYWPNIPKQDLSSYLKMSKSLFYQCQAK